MTAQGIGSGVPQEEHLAALELVKRCITARIRRESPDYEQPVPGIGQPVSFPVGVTLNEIVVAFKIGTGFGDSGCWHYKRRKEDVEKLR